LHRILADIVRYALKIEFEVITNFYAV
jgi:hypothetical protein